MALTAALSRSTPHTAPPTLAALEAEDAQPPSKWDDDEDYRDLFNGRDLEGWKVVGGSATYEVEDGQLVGNAGSGPNTFLRTLEEYDDFVLRVELRFDVPGNSGIQFRSHQKHGNGQVYGYQCEVDPSDRAWSGGLYDEGRRGWLVPLEGDDKVDARKAFKNDDWNEFVIRCRGEHIEIWVNDVKTTDTEDDADARGFIALQVHTGGVGKIRWRRVRLRDLNEEKPDKTQNEVPVALRRL